jgi:hypothetical protein
MIESRLYCHSGTPCSVINDLVVEVGLNVKGDLRLHYRLSGDLARISIPVSQTPAAVDGLWAHTCLEVFITAQHDESYHEFNFSPSGHYAMYAFSSYRTRAEWLPANPPSITFSKIKDLYELQAVITGDDLPVNSPDKPYQLGLSAVIELNDGSKSFWALHHPSEYPDFHDRDSFVLSINRSEFI